MNATTMSSSLRTRAAPGRSEWTGPGCCRFGLRFSRPRRSRKSMASGSRPCFLATTPTAPTRCLPLLAEQQRRTNARPSQRSKARSAATARGYETLTRHFRVVEPREHLPFHGAMRDSGPFRPWTAKEEAKLGVLTDQELARQTGRSVRAVRTRRQRRHLAQKNPLRRPWTPEEEKLLGTATDNEVARLLGRD